MANQANYELRYQDFSKEESTVKFTSVEMDGGNYNAQMILAHDLRAAVDNITLGARVLETVISERKAETPAVPTDKNCQRERKWLVVFRDETQYFDFPSTVYPNPGHGKKFTLEIPTADNAMLPAGHSDHIDPDEAGVHANITAFVAAFEAFQKSPYGGDVEVIEIVQVGRNL